MSPGGWYILDPARDLAIPTNDRPTDPRTIGAVLEVGGRKWVLWWDGAGRLWGKAAGGCAGCGG